MLTIDVVTDSVLKKNQFNVQIPPEVREELQRMAERSGAVSDNKLAAALVEVGMDMVRDKSRPPRMPDTLRKLRKKFHAFEEIEPPESDLEERVTEIIERRLTVLLPKVLREEAASRAEAQAKKGRK